MTSLKTLSASRSEDAENKKPSDLKNGTEIPSPTMHANDSISSKRADRIVQNYRLIWLDSEIDEINDDQCMENIRKLQQIVYAVKTFTNIDECTTYITSVEDEKLFLIISGGLGETMVRLVHDKVQINCFYIFCTNEALHEQWVKEWPKVKGVYSDIDSICAALKQTAQACDHNLASIGFIKPVDETSNENLDQLDHSFMYTQVLKEILLTLHFDDSHINQFVTYCREQFSGNSAELVNVEKLQQEYRHHQPIWWYTYDCFLYSMLSRVLRLMEVDQIVKMGFFLQDLQRHIATLHAEQYGQHQNFDSFKVYRGQGISQTDFDQLQATKGGLLSFNNFLFASQDYDVSLRFAQRTIVTSSLVGVLFVLKIDPSISSVPFANIGTVSYYQGEQEILFSMNSVFRIGQVAKIDNEDRLWQVDLTLTSDNDPQLLALTDSIAEETEGSTGWLGLSKLMMRIAQCHGAKGFHETLLAQTTDERERGELYYQLGCVESGQAEYANAISSFSKSLAIRQNALTSRHPDVADCYESIGHVKSQLGDLAEALLQYRKALSIRKHTLSPDHPHLATSYTDIGLVYDDLGNYSKALSYHQKALKMYQSILTPNHPDLVPSYNNVGLVYDNKGDHSEALAYYEKALEIRQTILPPNHPHLATSYNNIGLVYDSMGDHSKALSYHEKALEIRQTTFPPDHPDLVVSYNNIGLVYDSMGEYSEALSYHEKALEIRQTTLPPNHPDLAACYNNIGLVYDNMGAHLNALSYYDKALEIQQPTLPANHPDLATTYNNMGSVYDSMGEYSKALSYYEQALEIRQATLPPNHPHLVTSYNNIGLVYDNMHEYSEALSYYERALEIQETTLSPTPPDSIASYNNVGSMYDHMGEYLKALPFYERALDILKHSPSPDHHSLEHLEESIETVKKKLEAMLIVFF